MKFPSKEIVELVKKDHPKGTRVKLVKMDDELAPPIGTKGTVIGVDDTGSIMVSWDSGSSLSVILGEDSCTKLIMTEDVKKQILIIRETGLTNMFAVNNVQVIANEYGFYELVVFLEEHRKEYSHFILTGEEI